jgi:hypothetical protein
MQYNGVDSCLHQGVAVQDKHLSRLRPGITETSGPRSGLSHDRAAFDHVNDANLQV